MAEDRMRKVNELIHHAVSEIILRDIELPLDVFVTITSIQTTRDLRHATVYITVLPDQKRVSSIKILQKRQPFIQKQLGKKIKIKFTPQLHFQFDEGQIKAQDIYTAIDSIQPIQPKE